MPVLWEIVRYRVVFKSFAANRYSEILSALPRSSVILSLSTAAIKKQFYSIFLPFFIRSSHHSSFSLSLASRPRSVGK